MAAFAFYLDKPFKKGIDHRLVQRLVKSGKGYSAYLNPNDTAIYAWLTFPGKRSVKVNVAERIAARWWNFELGMPRRSMAGSATLIDRLEDLKAKILTSYRVLIAVNPNASLEELRDATKQAVKGVTPNFGRKTFLQFYDEYLLEKRTTVKELTLVKLASFRSVFIQYLDFVGKPSHNFFLESINDEFNISFRNYLLEERGVVNNTGSKHYECLKTFLRHCRRKGAFKQVNGDFEMYSIKRDHTDIIYLTQFEINQIINLDLEGQLSLSRVRDCFVFLLHTGQRYSDLAKLRSTNILRNLDGTFDWHLHQIKGNKPKKVIIPLLPEAIRVAYKYGLIDSKLPAKLPVLSNQKMNEKIKVICKMAGIKQLTTVVRYSGKNRRELTAEKWKLMTTHTCRRSFISLSLEKGMAMHLVQEISGHTNSRVIKESYAGLSTTHLRSSLFNAWVDVEKLEENDRTRRLLPD